MWRSETVGDGARPPVWRSIAYAAVVALASLVSLVFSPAGDAVVHRDGWGALVVLVSMSTLVGACMLLFWRHTIPVGLAIGAALLPLVLPVGNTFAFVALAALIGRRRGPAVWWAAALTAVTSTLVVLRDATATPDAASLARSLLAPTGTPGTAVTPVTPLQVAFLCLLGIALSVGAGLLVRAVRLSRVATDRADAEEQRSAHLGGEVARSAERERIAREVHDVMGHRLSIIALHAGVLEGAARAQQEGDPRVQQSAHLVRESAAAAVDDLHSLLDLLREPAGAESAPLPLTQLPQVVDESVRAGQMVASSIFVEEADQADPALSRAVHRVVQEVLTNARTHAPGQTVTLKVTGSPARGISIDAANPLPPDVAGPLGAVRGLAGLAERVEMLGGTLRHGPDADAGGPVFHVHADLPWRGA